MSNPISNTPRYLPLKKDSQSNSVDVLYFDSQVLITELLECATGRLAAAMDLNESLHEFREPPAFALQSVGIVTSLLLSDTMSLISFIQKKLEYS